jgi:hypothetical protein
MINLKGLTDAVTGKLPLDPSVPKAVMLDWKAQAKQEDSKTGLQAFFGAKKAAPSGDASISGEKRTREVETTLPAEKKPRPEFDGGAAAVASVGSSAISSAPPILEGPAPTNVDLEDEDAIIVSSPVRQPPPAPAKPATPAKKTTKPAGTPPITSFFSKK